MVLEGRDRLGGRIDTTILGDGSQVDLGASYIHGCNEKNRGNSVYEVARELGVELKREFGGYQEGWISSQCHFFADTLGNRHTVKVTPREFSDAHRVYLDVADAVTEVANRLDIEKRDLSVAEVLRDHLPDELQHRIDRMRRVTRLVYDRIVHTVWGYVAPLESQSARLMSDRCKGEDGEGHVRLELDESTAPSPSSPQVTALAFAGPRHEQDDDALVVQGYRFLIDKLQEGVDVRLEKTVASIVRSQRGVSVFTRDGERFDGDAVVVTVPLGVLKGLSEETRIRFVPPLSAKKQTAIEKLGMGVENKVVLRFDSPFWPISGSPYMQIMGELGLRFLSLHRYGKPGVLVAHLCPPTSIDITTLSDTEVVEKVLQVLHGVFGKDRVEKKRLLESIVTRWHQDPFCMGSYSFVAVDADFEHVHALKEQEGRLFFAGEATSAYDSQCVTGAFNTGAQVAHDVVDLLASRKCECCSVFFAPALGVGGDKEFCSSACLDEWTTVLQGRLYCICQTPLDGREYVECTCKEWYHLDCVGLEEAPISDYVCDTCLQLM